MVLDQDEIIHRFIKLYNSCQDTQFTITRWPDKEKENQGKRACDAYAEALQARPLAIEHTNIQTFRNQKLDSARFTQVIGVLETELKGAFPYEVTLIIPTHTIPTGIDWKGITATLQEWLLAHVSVLPFGHTEPEIEGVPFRVRISKADRRGRGFGVARWEPPGLDTNDELPQIVGKALDDKNDQLQKYRENGDETVLILESDDIALMNHVLLYTAFLKASPSHPTVNIDQIWMAETIRSEDWCGFKCFTGPDAIEDKVNQSDWMLGKRHVSHW